MQGLAKAFMSLLLFVYFFVKLNSLAKIRENAMPVQNNKRHCGIFVLCLHEA